MKNTSILFLILASVFACKKDTGKNKAHTKNETIVYVDSTKNDTIEPIKVYSILMDSIDATFSKEFLFLNNKLSNTFDDESKTKTSSSLQRKLKHMRENVFAKKISEDFKNPTFTKVKNILFSFLKNKHTPISLEEWQFESEKEAISCLNSLKNYENVIIHFKAFNWIWVQQKNKLYLISSINLRPSSKSMQYIKKELLSILEKNGSYQELEIY